MRGFKPIFGVIKAAVPIAYCGGLLFYFLDTTGSVEEAKAVGLGPTLLGLGAVGLLFCIFLLFKVTRIVTAMRQPGSGGQGSPGPTPGDDGFDADAVIARHLAQRAANPSPVSPPPAPTLSRREPASRPSFGRRIR